jgi:hypothetical protein
MDASCIHVLQKYSTDNCYNGCSITKIDRRGVPEDEEVAYYQILNDFLIMDQNKDALLKKYPKCNSVINFDEIEQDIETLDKCFEKADVTLDASMVLFRGVKTNLGINTEGQFLELKNYTSTSPLITKVTDFVLHETTGCCFYKLHIDKGIPYIDMTKLPKSAQSIEKEILLPRNLIMTYIRYYTISAAKADDLFGIDKRITVRVVRISKKEDNTTVETIPQSGGKNNKKKQLKKTMKKKRTLKKKRSKKGGTKKRDVNTTGSLSEEEIKKIIITEGFPRVLGLDEEEIEEWSNDGHIEIMVKNAIKNKLSKEEILENIEDYYKGYGRLSYED